MKYLLPIAVFGLLWILNAEAAEQIMFQPVIVETLQFEEEEIGSIRQLAPVVGIGAKNIDAPMNQFGIEIKNLEADQEISLLRRGKSWWLEDESNKKSEVRTNARIEAGNDTDYRLKTVAKSGKLQLAVEGEHYKDSSKHKYRENNNTPYTQGDDSIGTFNKEHERYFLSGKLKYSNATLLYERDGLEENRFASVRKIGRNDHSRNEYNLNYSSKNANSTLYLMDYKNRFRSSDDLNPTNISTGRKYGMKTALPVAGGFKLAASFQQETADRAFEEQTGYEFRRDSYSLALFHEWLDSRWVETRTNLTVDSLQETNQLRDNDLTFLNASTSISSSTQYDFGAAINFRYYQLAPPPRFIFGDFANLQGNPDLPLEKGIRLSWGPWYKTDFFKTNLAFFSEESKDTPIVTASTPSTSRAYPIGAIWTRGAEANANLEYGIVNFDFKYTYQVALNDSDINWQKGQPVAGRPKHSLNSSLGLHYKKFKLGSRYKYQAGQYGDLAGEREIAANYTVDAYLGYQSKSFETRIEANGLLMSDSLTEVYAFEGSAGDILEPQIPRREVRLVMEMKF